MPKKKKKKDDENIEIKETLEGIDEKLLEDAVKSVEDVKNSNEIEIEFDDSEEGDFSQELEVLQEQLEEKEKELEKVKDEYEDKLLRLAAEYDNYRKRTEKEKEEAFNFGHTKLIKDILPVIDNLERALDAAAKTKDTTTLLDGIKLVFKDFENIIKKYNVEPIIAQGENFDPNIHQAMTIIETDEHEPGIVIEEFQKGYKIKDRLIRPSLVSVSTKKKSDTDKEEKEEDKNSETK